MRQEACWLAVLGAGMISNPATAQEKLHFTFMWHMEQPVYWPDRQTTSGVLGDRYERLGESLTRGGVHPLNNLSEIFGAADRVAGYRFRMRDTISRMAFPPPEIGGTFPEGGAQISFSGGLIENLQSVGGTGLLSGQYESDWHKWIREARGWSTFGGAATPRADVVIFPFHHALMPLVDESTMRKEIQTYKAIYADAWGPVTMSKGFFPSEMAFSTRMIGVLADEGVEWSIVSGEKVSRASVDWPVVFGSGGTPCDPPNRADQMNPSQADYFRASIDRGCSPAESFPFSFTPHRARYVDPTTGVVKAIIVVPASQSLGWRDGYSAQGIGDFDTLNAKNNPARPMLAVLAHDGDNAWGGGYDYYMVATPNRVKDGRGAGYTPTVVQRYLADHPVPADDFVHVEDGAWVNADGDFGSPQFWNWNWPLLNSSGQPDPVSGWHIDARNWAVITAMQNRVDTAEQIHTGAGGMVSARKIVYPQEGANAVERAWHYFLGGLNSGFMYYGTPLDHEVKPTVACNNAARFTDPIISGAGPSADATAPTIWIPQRWPYNPGSQVFGSPYRQGSSYGPFVAPTAFTVWTFVADVSGVQSVTLKYRVDADGQRSLSSTENETYAGGAGVGAWQSVSMNVRAFPAGNVYNDPDINFFVMPQYIADHYSAQISGLSSALVDYYVEAVDTRGNVRRSPIQHVWVGDGQGATNPGGGCSSGTVTTQPCPPVAGQTVTVTYDTAGRNLSGAAQVYIHLGHNGWTGVGPDQPMSRSGPGAPWTYTYTVPVSATMLDCVFNNGSGTWDNNSGQDWHISVQSATPVNGACCVAGVCTATTQLLCGGTFTSGGACTPNPCPPAASGACCSAGTCTSTTQAACAAGSWISGGACAPNPCAFVMDGVLDAGTIVVAESGPVFLRAALRGDVLYVAAANGADTNDRFIYLAPAAGPGPMQSANWAKAGQVAGWSCFLGSEGSASYNGWQEMTGGAATASAKSTTGVIEGTINLRQEFALGAGAPLPESIYLATAQYPTADGATLLAALQLPAGNGNGNIEAAEYARVRLCRFTTAGCCAADFNGSGGSPTVQDIFDFLGAWFNGCTGQSGLPCEGRSADFNNSGGSPTVQDIFDFLAAWFAGC